MVISLVSQVLRSSEKRLIIESLSSISEVGFSLSSNFCISVASLFSISSSAAVEVELKLDVILIVVSECEIFISLEEVFISLTQLVVIMFVIDNKEMREHSEIKINFAFIKFNIIKGNHFSIN